MEKCNAAARGLKTRPASPADMDEMMRIYDSARAYMAASGNPNQWTGGYPSRELLLCDIGKEQLYVCEAAGGRLCGAFVLARGEDPTYAVIEDGRWPSDDEYATIHRIASDGSVRGVFEECLAFALSQCGQVRVDTHHDNRVMQKLLKGHGFARCGIIHIADGSPRIAYQYSAK